MLQLVRRLVKFGGTVGEPDGAEEMFAEMVGKLDGVEEVEASPPVVLFSDAMGITND